MNPSEQDYNFEAANLPIDQAQPESDGYDSDGVRQWLANAEHVCQQAASGNLEVRLLHLEANPELAPLGRSINHLLDMTDALLREAGASLTYASQGKFFRRVLLGGMLGSFRNTSRVINTATEDMEKKAHALDDAQQQRTSLAASFERSVKSLVSELTDSAAQVSSTSQHLADAAGVKVEGSANGATAAANNANNLQAVTATLAEASRKIGGVVKLISKVTAQTHLLALNATIEAARAGAAGSGFAVVASEVKNLARQTATATEEITNEIAAMRATAERTAQLVTGISGIIQQMSEISHKVSHDCGALSGSVEEFVLTIRA